ncbi:MarR family winged helix-turn-helix transcriptional regulator [Lactococcus protaetiae]|uniref:Winged helix-turn-helix transcriptional regulator n=1 Tax=Lactococcus protaetiae TaxID=2592653 RepID=A0A514Z8P8_9LACT|nr:MarR family winged helix-turn-helix transcriptional regulator [Lactococcus protaetiae]QDK70970.1 winged helix-turn-helix transcriptional regulator [Lactococcus protaetiae]
MTREQAERFTDIVKAVNQSEAVESFNLYAHGEMLVLVHLARAFGQTVFPSEIAEATRTSPTRVAKILNTLEKKGYIVRKTDVKDRRKVQVSVTELGNQKALQEKEKALTRISNVLEEMGQDDSEQFIRLLTQYLTITERQSLDWED